MLKAKRYLQVDTPVRTGRAVTARKAVGLAEERRTQIADRCVEVHVIKNIPCRNAERQIVAVVGCSAVHSATAAAAETTAPAPAATAALASLARLTLAGRAVRRCLAARAALTR